MASEQQSAENPVVRGAVVTALLGAGALYYAYRRARPASPQAILDRPATQSAALVQRGQQVLETTLDQLSEQAMAEVKVILKRGLHRLETMVDDL